jgi:hypothetical protein
MLQTSLTESPIKTFLHSLYKFNIHHADESHGKRSYTHIYNKLDMFSNDGFLDVASQSVPTHIHDIDHYFCNKLECLSLAGLSSPV